MCQTPQQQQIIQQLETQIAQNQNDLIATNNDIEELDVKINQSNSEYNSKCANISYLSDGGGRQAMENEQLVANCSALSGYTLGLVRLKTQILQRKAILQDGIQQYTSALSKFQ